MLYKTKCLITIFTTVVILTVLNGCFYNIELPVKYELEAITINAATHVARGGDGHFFLSAGETETFSAAAVGADAANVYATEYKWSRISGNSVQITGGTDGKTANFQVLAATGESRIKVEAYNPNLESGTETVFSIYVNDPDIGDWAFVMFDGLTEISGPVTLVIPDLSAKNINIFSTADNVTFNWETPSSGAVTVTPFGAGSSGAAITGVAEGDAVITVSGMLSGKTESFSRTLIVTVIDYSPNPNVLFRWNSIVTPIKSSISETSPVASGFGNIFFRIRGSNRTDIVKNTADGNFTLGEGSESHARLIIGGTPQTSAAETSAGAHYPGVFDLSKGWFRLTLNFENAQKLHSGDYVLRVNINNNALGGANSVLSFTGSHESILRQYNFAETLISGHGASLGKNADIANGSMVGTIASGSLAITFSPEIIFAAASENAKTSLETAFIALAVPNLAGGNRMDISGIRLEKWEQ